jgi:2-oxoglutarate/2-oxoacid ferredoxin oxidoreductase subunit alpha
LVMRPGPATGMPTWTSQGDLLHAVNSGHGEFPLIVMAPGDHKESFEMGKEALNLAAKLQMPVMVISDKFLGEGGKTEVNLEKEKMIIEKGKIIRKVDENYLRYTLKTKTGVSPLSLPGTRNGEFLANSYEHDEEGFATEESKMTEEMTEKRFKKMRTALSMVPKYKLFSKKSKKLIVSWGSTKGTILEAIESLDFDFLQIRTVWPIDIKIKDIINKYKKIIVVENNATSQLTTLLKSQFDFNPNKLILKADGRPFFPEELVHELSK